MFSGMKKTITITLFTILAVIALFAAYERTSKVQPVGNDDETSLTSYSFEEAGITFQYESDLGVPVEKSSVVTCPGKDVFDTGLYADRSLNTARKTYYELFFDTIKNFEDEECIKHEVFIGTNEPNPLKAKVYIKALNENQILLEKLPPLGKEGVDYPFPPTTMLTKDGRGCSIYESDPLVSCAIVDRNGFTMRRTELYENERISDVPRYEYSFYNPNTQLGIMISAGSPRNAEDIALVEQIVNTIEIKN